VQNNGDLHQQEKKGDTGQEGDRLDTLRRQGVGLCPKPLELHREKRIVSGARSEDLKWMKKSKYIEAVGSKRSC